MNVKWYLSDTHCCGHVRAEIIARDLNQNFPNVNVDCKTQFMLSDVPKTNVMVFQRQYTPALRQRMLYAKSRGILTIYDLDDDLFNVPAEFSSASQFFSQPYVQAEMQLYMQQADLVTVSTGDLAQAIRKYSNTPIFVIENCLDVINWARPPRDPATVVIGWVASHVHKTGVPLVSGPLLKLLREFPQVRVQLIGCVGFAEAPELKEFEGRVDCKPWVDIAALPDVMSRFDIGLAPLWKHPFNDCKSNIKALQYWANETAVVCSPRPPYSCVQDGVNGLYADGEEQWYAQMKRLVENVALRKELGAKGRQTVVQKFDVRAGARNWLYVFGNPKTGLTPVAR